MVLNFEIVYLSCKNYATKIMNLSDIEAALKGQFIFKGRRRRQGESGEEYLQKTERMRPLYTDEYKERFETLAFMVFIAVSLESGYDEDSIQEHLGMNQKQYVDCRRQYEKYMSKARRIKESGFKLDPQTKHGKVWNKTNLVRNRLRLSAA
jgi:hypothetical protein